MREIIFRGKRTEDGEWVYGLPYAKSRYSVIRSTECLDMNDEEVHMHSLHVVIPETVGQYTGLKDKNGKKIYEGDVLYHPIQGKRKVYYPFRESVASYGLRMIEGEVKMASTLSEGFLYEIIGNIHEEVQE